MNHASRYNRTAANALRMFTPQGSGRHNILAPEREQELPYARSWYSSFEAFSEAVKRDHKVVIEDRYRGATSGPVEVSTNCRIRLYFDKEGPVYRMLTAKRELTAEEVSHAFANWRQI